MGIIRSGDYKIKLMSGDAKVNRAYAGDVKIYSAGNAVTYIVDSGITYQEEVDEGASCLLPKTFTPSKSGWEFKGWRQDVSPYSDTLTSLAMGDEPITLYAVFRQTVTVTYYNGSTTAASSTSQYRWYNNGNIINPVFALTQSALSGWTTRGWSASTAGDGAISYNNGAYFERDSNVTLYGMYYRTITLTYYNGSTTAATTSGTRYYNSGSGNATNPTFSLTPAALSGWSFRGWATSSAATAGIAYSSISGTAFAASTTVYAAYSQTITLSYNGNGNTSGSTAAQTGTRYFNTGNYGNPSFTLAANGFAKSNYTFSKWALGSASGTQYAAGASITLSANNTMYAVWIASAHYFTPLNGVTWSITSDYGTDNNLTTSTSKVELTARKPEAGTQYGVLEVSAHIPTGGCKKAKFTATLAKFAGGYISYNNTRKDFTSSETANVSSNVDFDISGDYIDVKLGVFNGSSAFSIWLQLTSIYFYN